VVDHDHAKEQLIACAKAIASQAEHLITPGARSEHDFEIRKLLDRIIRRWPGPITYTTNAARRAPREATMTEHVVPCRVLVDRMIMHPNRVRRLLENGVVLALITKPQHRKLDHFALKHPTLYGSMLKSPAEKLHRLGLRRYLNAGITLIPQDDIVANGRRR
jgi:hypothetical protein